MKTEQISLFVRIRAKAGKRDECEALLERLFEQSRLEPSFVTAAVHRDAMEHDVLAIYETWNESRDSFLEHAPQRAYFAKCQQNLEPLVERRDIWWLETPPRRSGERP